MADSAVAGRGPGFPLLLTGVLGGAAAVGLVWVLLTSSSGNEPAVAGPPPHFVEVAASAGIDHSYDGDFTFFVGGGVAVFDCDADGRSDVYLAGGTSPAALYRNQSELGGELHFQAVTDRTTDLLDVVGAYPIDIDGDTITDLAVLRLGENVLLHGRGDCSFERANEQWSFHGEDQWTAAFSAKWESPDALPTLAFGNYLDLDDANRSTGECAPNLLLRPNGGGYSNPTELSPGWCTLSILFSDWDRSGRRDLRVANDRHYYRDGQEQLWAVAAGEPPYLYTDADGWQSLQIWGMGIASSDVTGDGLPEFFITSQGDNKLQTLADGATQPMYEDIAIRRGVTAHRPFTGDATLPSTAWHPEFADVNNDGYADLYISKGNVEAMPDFATADPSNLLLGQTDGTFVDSAVEAGLISMGRSRGAALADFNLDGMLDVIEVNRQENVKLWRNLGAGDESAPKSMGNWLALRLEQTGANRDAVGSWIQVRLGDRTIERELTIGGGHAGGQLGWVHFGIGNAGSAEVRIIWPDGETGPWLNVGADTFVVINRGADVAREWKPGFDD